MKVFNQIKTIFKKWYAEQEAIAAVEAALIFPILMMLLLGTFDMGNAILTNQKAIRASQIVADLITRERSVTSSDVDEAIEAGQLAFVPFASDAYGVDVVSISFDEDEVPSIEWRETRNMSPDSNVLQRVLPVAEPNGGVVVVLVRFDFSPAFGSFVVSQIPMLEIAFAKGRKSAVVSLE